MTPDELHDTAAALGISLTDAEATAAAEVGARYDAIIAAHGIPMPDYTPNPHIRPPTDAEVTATGQAVVARYDALMSGAAAAMTAPPRPSTTNTPRRRAGEVVVTRTNAGPGPEVMVSDGRFVATWPAADVAGLSDDELRAFWTAYRDAATTPEQRDNRGPDERQCCGTSAEDCTAAQLAAVERRKSESPDVSTHGGPVLSAEYLAGLARMSACCAECAHPPADPYAGRWSID